MQANLDLIITADSPNRRAELELRDQHGAQLAYRLTDFKTIDVSQQRGLFDLRNYLRIYAEGVNDAASVAALGVCIAEQVLGAEIFKLLYASESQRTLRIQLPGATGEENQLAAALARVPWEIARPSADKPTLGERNLLLRVVHEMQEPATHPLDFNANESLRVLFVFGEAQGSTPLAVRKERQELLRLFEKEIYPTRRIEAHFLSHGVTRERLRDEIERNGGYHIVHWSGHGHLNLLELAKAEGGSDHLSGEDLLGLFKFTGLIPRLFFLSACHSGEIVPKNWNDFTAAVEGKEPDTRDAAETKDIAVDEQPGYTGTAHALLQGGVPAVVAMRYAVGDEYARDLTVEFYRLLLAQPQPKTAAAALTMARKRLLAANDQSRYAACDHATPLLYGAEHPGLRWEDGRSPALNPRDPHLHQITELTTAAHEHFVGRTWQLAGLGAQFIGADDHPVAVITGLGGMGKTALTAEALDLWQTRFDWVLLYQAKPNALSFENTLRDIHMKLNGELKLYHKHIQQNPADAICREASAEFTGAERFERLTRNLIRALKDEAILLVLDNFETNLKPQADATDATPRWACQDAAWERCLTRLATELIGSRSRVWLTCRHALTALDGAGCHAVLLGPLPAGEAALYLREHAGLSRMFFSSDTNERVLAMRLLNASRFHPLLMDRLAKLAVGGAALRDQLLQALDTLEQTKDFARLPELFATTPGDVKELDYLEDALIISNDLLIQQASLDARRLLWMIAVANKPIELSLLQEVWSGEESEQTKQLRQIKQMLEMLPQLPPHVQEQLKAIPPEYRAMLDALPPPTTDHRPPATDHLPALISVGLVTKDDNQTLTCHELVRERIRARMNDYPHERDGLTENDIRLSYADRLAALFKSQQMYSMTAALSAGSRALVYCVQAEAYERLGEFASGVVTSTRDPRLLAALIPHLQAAAESAPEGQLRWRCLGTLADALALSGRPDASLPFYEQAAAQARVSAELAPAESANAQSDWADLAATTGNWATALRYVSNLDAAHQRQLESAEAKKKAGSPAVDVIICELEALRIEIMGGQVAEALPQVEARLARVETWWRQHRAGQCVPEAPDPAFLARAIIGALDIARKAHFALKDWESALRRIDEILEVEHALKSPAESVAGHRMNRANVLGNLGRFGEAQAELETCLQVFQHDSARSAKALGSLADLFSKQGDVAQAVKQQRRTLALCEQLPDPSDRAISHENLAIYLDGSDTPAALAEAPCHRLAALIYRRVAELGQDMQNSLSNYAIRFRRAHEAGTPLAVPRVADLLAAPAFDPLARWLRGRQVDVDELQVAVDELLEQVRQQAIGHASESPE